MQYSRNYGEAKNSLTIFNQIYFMLAEHEAALRILMNDDLYLNLKDLEAEEKETPEVVVEKQVKEKPKPEFIFTGKNQKNFLILTNEVLQQSHLKALENTLLRKQLSLNDVAIIDYSASANKSFDDINTSFTPQKIVCFGLKPQNLNLPKAAFNEISTFENLQILYTYSFTEMLGNKEKTKAFWEPMKNL